MVVCPACMWGVDSVEVSYMYLKCIQWNAPVTESAWCCRLEMSSPPRPSSGEPLTTVDWVAGAYATSYVVVALR